MPAIPDYRSRFYVVLAQKVRVVAGLLEVPAHERQSCRPIDDALLDELRAAPSEACLAEIFRRNRCAVLSRCRWMLGDSTAVEDLTQETFAVAFATAAKVSHSTRGNHRSRCFSSIHRDGPERDHPCAARTRARIEYVGQAHRAERRSQITPFLRCVIWPVLICRSPFTLCSLRVHLIHHECPAHLRNVSQTLL